jgi:hypothetical protein
MMIQKMVSLGFLFIFLHATTLSHPLEAADVFGDVSKTTTGGSCGNYALFDQGNAAYLSCP